MEMISFQPYVCSPPRLRGMHIQYPYFYQGSPPLTRLGGKYYNRKGERFMRKYDPIKMENTGNNALLKSNIPIVNTLGLEELKALLESRDSRLEVSLKNLIYNHAYSISLFQYEYRPLCNEIISNIKTYLGKL